MGGSRGRIVTKLMGFRAAMFLAMCGIDASRSPVTEAADWWARFVREMEAIGCANVRQNPSSGEWEFDCPPERLAQARAIVARYSVK